MEEDSEHELDFNHEPHQPLATSEALGQAWLAWLFDFCFPLMIVIVSLIVGHYGRLF